MGRLFARNELWERHIAAISLPKWFGSRGKMLLPQKPEARVSLDLNGLHSVVRVTLAINLDQFILVEKIVRVAVVAFDLQGEGTVVADIF